MQSLEMETEASFINNDKKECLKKLLNQMLCEALKDHKPPPDNGP